MRHPPETAANPPPVRIFTFGASTMWGSGARDDYTIASYLSRLLHARGYRAQITNYGESAYVSTQSAITLLRGIHRGERPDIAIFYGGDNDMIASFVYGEAGIPHEEESRRGARNSISSTGHGRCYGPPVADSRRRTCGGSTVS